MALDAGSRMIPTTDTSCLWKRIFVFLFKVFPKTAVLIQITFLYPCFLQKFGNFENLGEL